MTEAWAFKILPNMTKKASPPLSSLDELPLDELLPPDPLEAVGLDPAAPVVDEPDPPEEEDDTKGLAEDPPAPLVRSKVKLPRSLC